MSNHRIRSEQRIKQDAKKIRKTAGVSHAEALDIAVKMIGYPNYHAYKKVLAQLAQKPNTVQLRNELVKRAIDYAIFTPTETGLKNPFLMQPLQCVTYSKWKTITIIKSSHKELNIA